MSLYNPFTHFAYGELFDTVLPDFVLAFAFFTSIVYLVVGKRFGQNRPAVALSATLGFALAIGLVWWEQAAGLSIRNLGPIAAGFALILLAGILYQAIKQTGGSWAGAGIAIGGCLLIGWVLGLRWPVDSAIIQTVTMVALTVGIIAFFIHRKGALAAPSLGQTESAWLGPERQAAQEDEVVSDLLEDRFKKLRKQSLSLHEHPRDAEDIMLQLRRMLPAEGYLTQRLAKLREKLYHSERGNIERIEGLEKEFSKLPSNAKAKAGKELAARYKELKFDQRLDRLDQVVAENEKRIRQITAQAQEYLAAHAYQKLTELLKAAQNLQKHNSRIFKLITRTESRLAVLARQAAKGMAAEANP